MELIVFLYCHETNFSHHGLDLPSSDTIVRLDSESASFRQPNCRMSGESFTRSSFFYFADNYYDIANGDYISPTEKEF